MENIRDFIFSDAGLGTAEQLFTKRTRLDPCPALVKIVYAFFFISSVNRTIYDKNVVIYALLLKDWILPKDQYSGKIGAFHFCRSFVQN